MNLHKNQKIAVAQRALAALEISEWSALLAMASEDCSEASGELDSAWQDKNAGRPWRVLASGLDRLSDRLDKI